MVQAYRLIGCLIGLWVFKPVGAQSLVAIRWTLST